MAGKGNPAIFKGKKARKYRYQGYVSKPGSVAFEAARTRLGELARRKNASDGDTFEYLALCHRDGLEATEAAIRATMPAEPEVLGKAS